MLDFNLCDDINDEVIGAFKLSEEYTRLKSLNISDYSICSDNLSSKFIDIGIISVELELHDYGDETVVYTYIFHVTTKFLSEVQPSTKFFINSDIKVYVDEYSKSNEPIYINDVLTYNFNIDKSKLTFADYPYSLIYESDLIKMIDYGIRHMSSLDIMIPLYTINLNESLLSLGSKNLKDWYVGEYEKYHTFGETSAGLNHLMIDTMLLYICIVDSNEMTDTLCYYLYYAPFVDIFMDVLYSFLLVYKFKSIKSFKLCLNKKLFNISDRKFRRLESVCEIVGT
jgi:hypothetical protein